MFDKALKRVLDHEGGYVNHPSDPGGETNYGITKRVAVDHGYTGPMRDIPSKVVSDIYHKSYWRAAGCHLLPFAVSYQVFDAAVNHGSGRAACMLQGLVGVTVDGIVGPKTAGAVNRLSSAVVASEICAERLKLFANLSHFNEFGRGWTRRIATNLHYIGEDTRG